MRLQLRAKAVLVAIATTVTWMAEVGASEVNLYSYREPERIVPSFSLTFMPAQLPLATYFHAPLS